MYTHANPLHFLYSAKHIELLTLALRSYERLCTFSLSQLEETKEMEGYDADIFKEEVEIAKVFLFCSNNNNANNIYT